MYITICLKFTANMKFTKGTRTFIIVVYTFMFTKSKHTAMLGIQ